MVEDDAVPRPTQMTPFLLTTHGRLIGRAYTLGAAEFMGRLWSMATGLPVTIRTCSGRPIAHF